MAIDQHQPSALDDFKLDFEETGTEGKISAFAIRKLAKDEKRAKRGPNLLALICSVYGEILFT